MADFVTALYATFGRKLTNVRGYVEDAFLNENTIEKRNLKFCILFQKFIHQFFN